MIEITIWNDKGEIVVQEECKALTASDYQIAEMVSLIENGCSAYLAAQLVKCGEGME